MKKVIWTDEQGYKHVSLLRDIDPDSAASAGIPCDPPDLSNILDDAKKELHNELINLGLLSYNDVVRMQSGIDSAIRHVLRSKIVLAYKQKDFEEET